MPGVVILLIVAGDHTIVEPLGAPLTPKETPPGWQISIPVVVIATKGPSYEKVISNIQEVKARKGIVIAVVTEADTEVSAMADYVIEIPETHEAFVPLVATIPLQLLSYHMAVLRGCNVDQPRNLAKSVTVE